MVSLQAALVATLISATSQTVLLDFHADWCPPCRAMNPTIQALIQEGYPVQKVNIDQHPQLKQEYGVTDIPCFVMLADGKEIGRVVGGTSFSCLERLCKRGLAARSQGPPPAQVAGAPVPKSAPGGTIPIPVTESPASLPALQPSSLPRSGLAARVSQASFTEPAAAGKSAPAAKGSPGWTPVSGDPVATKNALIASSVRLRIEDSRGHSCGSGTIVDARDGEALILTCGHIFRESKGEGRIDVDLFGPAAAQKVPGRLIAYDLDRDVGLVAIRPPGPVKVAPVAPPDYRVKEGDAVVSVGCNNGDRPSVRHSRVTSLDKYQGPANIEVAGMPVEGRSGGGLFTDDGKVIGVCFAADPRDKEGLYAALHSIHSQLDKAGLSFVYQAPRSASPRGSTMPKEFPSRPAPAIAAASPRRLGAAEQATLDEIRRRLEEGAEVICVVHPRNDPGARGEITLMEKASPQFLRQLAAEARMQNNLQPTSLEVLPERSPRRAVVPVARLSPAGADNANGWRGSKR